MPGGGELVNKRILRWLTIVLPVGFTLILLVITDLLFEERASLPQLFFALALVAVGTSIFSTWVFRAIDMREAEIARRANQLEALNAASQALTTELELATVLQKVVDLSRGLVTARYGALGVLNESGQQFEQFISSGISHEVRHQIGAPPTGKGVFSVLIEDAEPLRLKDIASHPRAIGFPRHHPEMKSLMGLPIVSKGIVIGDLYLADKVTEIGKDGEILAVGDFLPEDEQVLGMFALQAAIAIENAKLYRQVQQLAVLQERERFGMDLHDGIIQSIYAVGLMLEDVQRRTESEPAIAKEKISVAIKSLNQVIGDLRNYILNLRPHHFQGRDLVQGVQELARALRANTFMSVEVQSTSPVADQLTPEQTVEILHITQEALANVHKHSRASRVDISVEILDERVLQLIIEDNGVSIDRNRLKGASGNGLRNMRERAKGLNGEIEISPIKESGTRIVLRVPVKR